MERHMNKRIPGRWIPGGQIGQLAKYAQDLEGKLLRIKFMVKYKEKKLWQPSILHKKLERNKNRMQEPRDSAMS